MTVWRWEAHDRAGQVPVVDVLTDPWPGTAAQAADLAMAHLMLRAGDARLVAGWRVRAWADGAGEAWVAADEWLRTAEPARR